MDSTLLYRFHVSEDAASALQKLPACIDEANPMPRRKRATLRYDIRDLWRSLTMERSQRSVDYLNNPAFFSAYLRYFMPWNLVRLVALLTELPLRLNPGATIVDMGSGPLTFPIALYCAKPELRKAPLTFVCTDRAPRIMEAGKLILELLAAKHGSELPAWNIELRHARFGEPLHEKADLFSAVNVFNEFFWRHEGTLSDAAAELYRRITQYCSPQGTMLIVEPGEPRSGGLMSAVRAAAILGGDEVLAPCPHQHACPMPGIFRSGQEHISRQAGILSAVRMPAPRTKYPWCHFSISAGFAPRWLSALSEEAGLSKERLSFSFLFLQKQESMQNPGDRRPKPQKHEAPPRQTAVASEKSPDGLDCRIVSESFALPNNRSGKYACSPLGYTLISTDRDNTLPDSGSLLRLIPHPPRRSTLRGARPELVQEFDAFDQKTGAILISY
jgi:hypothetical protein